MAGLDFFGSNFQIVKASLGLRARRHELLVGNVVNADTPGYRSRDFDFAGVMKRFLLNQETAKGAMQRSAGGSGFNLASSELDSLVNEAMKMEKEGVDLDREVARIIENSLMFEVSLRFVSGKMAGLRYAISEGRG